jgi:hypothetical protein
MKISLRTLRIIAAVLAIVVPIIWFIFERKFDPIVTLIGGLLAILLFDWRKEGAAETTEQHNRRVLLDHVENFWVKGILEKSLHGAALIELGIQQDPQSIRYPWNIRQETTDKILPAGKSRLEIFQEIGMGHSLLILGAAGSGKTTELLELARQLIEKARTDNTYPIPIIFNLSSWKEKQMLRDWLVDQLGASYKVPKKTAQALVDNDQLLLLLDGLDEVRADQRNACITAINLFRMDHGLIPLVICSRSEEYARLTKQLEFEGAIAIQSLTPDQVNNYFAGFGNRLAGLKSLIEEDPVLNELTETPLMLSVMALAYLDTPAGQIRVSGDIETQRKFLFNTYIDRMFERPGRSNMNIFPKDKVIHWLIWLAKKMIFYRQIPFFIEMMQIDWIDIGKMERRLLKILISTILGIALGMIIGLITYLGLLMIFYFQGSSVPEIYKDFVVRPQNYYPIQFFIIPMATVTLYYISNIGVEVQRINVKKNKSWLWKIARNNLLVIFVTSSLIASLFFYSTGGFLIPIKSTNDFLFIGWLRLIGAILLNLGVILLLFEWDSEVSGKKIFEINSQNQQNEQSSTREFMMAGILGMFLGTQLRLLAGISKNPLFGIIFEIITFIISGLIAGLRYGGIALILHFLLCWQLNLRNCLPRKPISFLEQSVNLIFLRRVGGGYIFIHRLLMEHFAAMNA